MNDPAESLDKLTHTFTADRRFFDALMNHSSGAAFLEMSVWYIWFQQYLHDVQHALHDAGKAHGSDYQTWVVAMIGGTAQGIGMLMYMLARGVVYEAAAAGRRSLECLGMASHLVRDPLKAQCLKNEKSPEFEKAFIRGAGGAEAEKLRRAGIRYRFAGMGSSLAITATQLYAIFSRFNVHGGTMSGLTGIALTPTEHSCAFHNRSLNEVTQNLPLFKPILELAAIELMDLVGQYGTRTKTLNQAGACVLAWLDRSDPRWLDRLKEIRKQFGLSAPR